MKDTGFTSSGYRLVKDVLVNRPIGLQRWE